MLIRGGDQARQGRFDQTVNTESFARLGKAETVNADKVKGALLRVYSRGSILYHSTLMYGIPFLCTIAS